ncbi:MAG: polysaccharide deacetylase family protein [Paenibacillaceae bacterium]
MREKLLWGILVFLAIYMFIPWVLTRIFGIGVFRKGRVRREIAFTFDDGPDSNYTPLLLDLLKKHNAKATFFVLGQKAEQNPTLIQRIHDEGHQIGIHNYIHASNWLMTPWTIKKEHLHRSADVIESITGERPIYYRPPWGILNIWDFFLKKQYHIVFWSLMAYDWRSHISKKKLKNKLLRKISDGSVILLHDSGETFGADQDAPLYMLEALDHVLKAMKQKGFHCVRIDDMIHYQDRTTAAPIILSLPKQALIFFWMLWEQLFLRIFHVVAIDRENPLLKVRVREYTGSQVITLDDGEQLVKGDLIAELHLDNRTLFQLSADATSEVHLAIQIIRKMEILLPQVNLLLQNDPLWHDVKGLYGISMIHRGSKKLGFSVIDLPDGIFSISTQLYLKLLLFVLHPQGKKRLQSKPQLLVPKIIAMSKKEMMSRYLA